MARSLADLPPEKQAQLAQIVDLIRSAAEVEMIILFGSYARGDWADDKTTGYQSDFDVLAITRTETVADKLEFWSQVEADAPASSAKPSAPSKPKKTSTSGSRSPRIYNIEKLGKQAADLAPALRDVFPRDTPEADHDFKQLKHAYVDARYSKKYKITEPELHRLAAHIRHLRDLTSTTCKSKLAELDSLPGA